MFYDIIIFHRWQQSFDIQMASFQCHLHLPRQHQYFLLLKKGMVVVFGLILIMLVLIVFPYCKE